MPNIEEHDKFLPVGPERGKATDLYFRSPLLEQIADPATAPVIFTTVRTSCIVSTNFELMYIMN